MRLFKKKKGFGAISNLGTIIWIILGMLVAISIAITVANKGLFPKLDIFSNLR